MPIDPDTPRSPNDPEFSPEERLRLQNELDAAALTDDFGAILGFGRSPDFTPEMEAQFLARVRALEEDGPAHYVPIASLLQRGLVEAANEAAAQERYTEAIKIMLRGLVDAGVASAQPEWLTDPGFYHFLVNDLLAHRVPKPPPPEQRQLGNGEQHIIYVDYDQVRSDSPNYLVMVTEAFLIDLLNPGEPFSGDYLAKRCRGGREEVSRETALATIRAWKEQWTEIVPVGFAPGVPLQGPDGALYFRYGCEYRVTRPTGEEVTYSGEGIMQLDLEGGEYRVVGCSMEGFEM